jgi:hypothetical protein
VLQIIVDYKGCVVPDIEIRHGHRARRSNDAAQELLGDCTTKPRPKQRITSLALAARICHPDAAEARRRIKDPSALTDLEEDAEALDLLMDGDSSEDEDDRALREADLEEEEA